jgi:hypothetical protein
LGGSTRASVPELVLALAFFLFFFLDLLAPAEEVELEVVVVYPYPTSAASKTTPTIVSIEMYGIVAGCLLVFPLLLELPIDAGRTRRY